jgi:hypothetical protein
MLLDQVANTGFATLLSARCPPNRILVAERLAVVKKDDVGAIRIRLGPQFDQTGVHVAVRHDAACKSVQPPVSEPLQRPLTNMFKQQDESAASHDENDLSDCRPDVFGKIEHSGHSLSPLSLLNFVHDENDLSDCAPDVVGDRFEHSESPVLPYHLFGFLLLSSFFQKGNLTQQANKSIIRWL